MDKRGISAIIATVLIILITISAVTILWVSVVPLVRDKIELSSACLDARVDIETSSGYTCYDSEKKITAVKVVNKASDQKISKLSFFLGSKGSSSSLVRDFALGKNSAEVFYLAGDVDMDEVSVAPILKFGGSEKLCDIVSKASLVSCVLSSVDFGDETIGFWRFETEADDISGGNNGEFLGGAGVIVDPIRGKVVEFNGTKNNSFIKILDDDALDLSDDITISFWINPYSINPGYAARVISKWTNTSDANFVVYLFGDYNNFVEAGNITVYANSAGEGWNIKADRAYLTLNRWTHVAWTYNSVIGGQLYIDGIASGVLRPGTGPLMTNNAELRFGGIQEFDGSMDDIRIWNRVLSPDEILELANF